VIVCLFISRTLAVQFIILTDSVKKSEIFIWSIEQYTIAWCLSQSRMNFAAFYS